jgi:aldehyde dehydrogenase (NAD+)
MTTSIQTNVRDRLYVGGEWIEPSGAETISVVNPATEEDFARVPAGTAEDVDRAVAAAREAFASWAATPACVRGELLAAIAERLSERGDEIATTITTELGMPISLSRLIQVGLPTMTFASMRGLLDELPDEEEIGNSLVVRDPIGVVAAIAPWNYPCTRSLPRSHRRSPPAARSCSSRLR